MTPTHAPVAPVTRRTADDVIRGLLAVIALGAFVIGVPVALLVVAPVPVPARVPTWEAVIGTMTRPDDGTLLVGAIGVIAWVTWAAFTVSVIAELVAAVRRVNVPHIPLLGGAQRLAAMLVTTAGLLLATSTQLMSTAAGEAVAAPALVAPTDVPDQDVQMAPAVKPKATSFSGERHAPEAAPLPTITVQRGDTLWDIAERHLGDGHRYTEILTLNIGRPQGDGSALDDAHWIYPGWQLRLPHGATGLRAATAAAVPGDMHGTHTVERGDTLRDIARDHLGDPSRYPEIVALNQGMPQPDGGALIDPDLIKPGWTLVLPATADLADARDAPAVISTPAPFDEPSEASPVPPVEDAAPTGGDRTPHVDDGFAAVDDAGDVTDDAPPLADDARSTADDAVEDAVDTTDDADTAASARSLYLGLTALAATGFIGELARRRKLQQRARRLGQRIALPAPGSPGHDSERTLRDAIPPVTIPALKQALLNLASRCYSAERDLPRLAAITLTSTDVVLHLLEDDPDPVEPFLASGKRAWVAPHSVVAADPVIDDPERPEPFPALVTLGHTADGTVLLNLEAAGTLVLTGDAAAAADVLRALVAELAISDLTGRIGLIAGPDFAALAGACDSVRLQIATPEALTAQITQRSADVTRALNGTGTDDTLQARSDRAVGDVWLPVVYITGTTAICASPWSGSTVIGLDAAAHGGWNLNVEADRASLNPLGLTLQPQRLTPASLDSLVDLLVTAAPPGARKSPTEAPAIDDEIADALTALPTPAPSTTSEEGGPPNTASLRINVLGPISIEGIRSDDGATLSRRSTELLVYLALRGQATGPELDEALWHGQRIDNQTRNSLVYRTRQRVSAAVFPVVGPDGIYRLAPSVGSDWSEFQALAHRGLAARPAGLEDLQAALDLVRDRPLLGIRDRDYTWAEYDIQHMISAIVDTAHVLSRSLAEAGEHRAAIAAATNALRVDPCSELLYRAAVDAARTMGDEREVDRLRTRLEGVMRELDPEFA